VVTIPVQRTISAWNSTCAVTSGGALYCWGANGSGQVGDGTLVDRPAPVRIRPDLTFASVSVGAEHACAVTTSGVIYCWGNNPYGQLGDGTTQARFTPAPVTSSVAFTRVAAGSLHTCALATTGAAYCWGGNQYGQMGIGSTTIRSSTMPVAVAGGRTYTSIDAGWDQSCAVATSGEGYCWGAYEYGRTGTTVGPVDNCAGIFCVPAPAPVAGGHTWRVISAGLRPTCGVTTSDQAYCWGDIPAAGSFSYTGYQGTTPVLVQGGIAFRTVSAGDRHACGISTTGAAWCWGTNNAGQLGTGPGAPSNNQPKNGPTPQPVLGGLSFEVLAAGVDHTCGITTGGAAYCWGANGSGQLGTGTFTPSPVPAPVAGGITFLRARAR
jgi:alpha-tubulin suppressor-like RCC1 family protein